MRYNLDGIPAGERAKFLAERRDALQEQYGSAFGRFLRTYAAPIIPIGLEALGEPARLTRVAVGLALYRDTQLAKDFRYESLPFFHGIATWENIVRDEYSDFSQVAKPATSPDRMERMVKKFRAEVDQGFPWAKAHRDEVESLNLMTWDPMLGLSLLGSMAKNAQFAKEITGMTPIFEKMLATPNSNAFLREAIALSGPDVISPEFEFAVRKAARDGGLDARAVAMLFHQDGFRPSAWSMGQDATWAGKLFRRGGEATSEEAAKFVRESQRAKDFIMDQVDLVRSMLTPMSGKDLYDFQWLLHNVPRIPEAPVDSFEANYARMFHEGALPEGWDLREHVYENAKKAVDILRSGFKMGEPSVDKAAALELSNLNAKMDKAFMEMAENADFWDEVKGGMAPGEKASDYAKDEPFPGAVDRYNSMVARWSELNGIVTKGKAGLSGWMDTYGPSAWLVGSVEESALPWEPGTPGPRYDWTRERRGAQGYFKDFDNVVAWLSSVSKRYGRIEQTKEALKEVSEYRQRLTSLMENIKTLGGGSSSTAAGRRLDQLSILSKHLSNLEKELKALADDTGAARYAAKEKNPALAAYDYGLGKIRQLQVLSKPGTTIHLALSHFLKNVVETGEMDPGVWKKIVNEVASGHPSPVFTPDGARVSFRQHLGLMNRTRAAMRAGEASVLDYAGNAISATIGTMRDSLGSRIAAERYGQYVAAGVPKNVAGRRAFQYALKIVNQVHGDYENLSPVDQVLKRLFMYHTYNASNLATVARTIGQYPSEAHVALRAYDAYYKNSVGQKGVYPIPGTEYGTDYVKPLYFSKLFDLARDPQRALMPEENAAYAPMRALEIGLGNPVPGLNEAAQFAGLKPGQDTMLGGSTERVVGAVLRALTGSDTTPSDYLSNVMGRDPQESRQSFLDRRAAFIAKAHDYEQAKLPEEQRTVMSQPEAHALAEHYDTVNRFSEWATGFKMVPRTEGIRDLTSDMDTAKAVLATAKNWEEADSIKAYLKQTPLGQRLGDSLPKTPSEKLSMDLTKSVHEWQQKQGWEPMPGTQTPEDKQGADKQERLGNLKDALQSSPALAPFKWLMQHFDPASPASAAEIPQMKYKVVNGNVVAVDSRSDDPESFKAMSRQEIVDAAHRSAAATMTANRTWWPKLNSAQTFEERAKIIDETKDMDGKPFVLQALQQMKQQDGNARAAQFLEGYDYVKSGGKAGSALAENDPAVLQARLPLNTAFSRWVLEAKDAGTQQARLNATPQQVRDAITRGEINSVVRPNTVDDAALAVARNGISPQAMGMALSKHADDLNREFPGNIEAIQRLQDAARNPYAHDRVGDVIGQVDFTKGKEGGIDPEFWQRLKSDPKTSNLYEDLSYLQHWKQFEGTLHSVSVYGTSGKFYGVDPGLLLHAIENGAGPTVGALLNYDKDHAPYIAQAMDRINEWLGQNGVKDKDGKPFDIRDAVPVNKDDLGRLFSHDLDVRVGNAKPWFDSPYKVDTDAGVRNQAGIDLKQGVPTAMKNEQPLGPVTGRPAKQVTAPPQEDVDRINQMGEHLVTQPTGGRGMAAGPSVPRQDEGLYERVAGMPVAPTSFSGPSTGLSITSPGPIIARDQPMTPAGYLMNAIGMNERVGYAAQSAGIPTPDAMLQGVAAIGGIGGNNPAQGKLFSPTPDTDLMDRQHVMGYLNAAGSLTAEGGRLFGSPEAVKAGQGLSTALSTFMALQTLTPGIGQTPPGLIVEGTIAAAAGIFGSGVFGGHSDRTQEFKDMQAARDRAVAERAAEIQRSNDIRSLQNREQVLSRSEQASNIVRGASAANQVTNTARFIQDYRRYPTYQSRIGLVDAVERQMSSALAPRW